MGSLLFIFMPCHIVLICSSLESEITSRLRTWRQALDRCRSAPQVCLCLLQLEKAIAWERSVTKVASDFISSVLFSPRWNENFIVILISYISFYLDLSGL